MSVRKINRNTDFPTQGYKGLFKGISENLNVDVGKKLPDGTFAQKEHHFNIGWKPWQQSNETVYEVDYNKKPIYRQENYANKNLPSIQIAHVNMPYKKESHFTSEQMKYIKHEGAQPAKPLRDKQTLLKAQIVMGEDRPDYKTTQVMYQEPKPPQRILNYHAKPERFDIITNNDLEKEKKQRANVFDYWDPIKDKKHISANYSEIPKLQVGRMDPITGRLIY